MIKYRTPEAGETVVATPVPTFFFAVAKNDINPLYLTFLGGKPGFHYKITEDTWIGNIWTAEATIQWLEAVTPSTKGTYKRVLLIREDEEPLCSNT